MPDANVPVSIQTGGVAVAQGNVQDPEGRSNLGWPLIPGARSRHWAPGFCSPSADCLTGPAPAEGLEFDLVVPVNPEDLGTGNAWAVERYVAMTRTPGTLPILVDRQGQRA